MGQSSSESAVDLDLDKGWRIGEAAFAWIVSDLTAVRPAELVEFGAGASSIRLAQALPGTNVLAIDHDPTFHQQEQSLLSLVAEPPTNLVFALRPLVQQRVGVYLYPTYTPGPFPMSIDAVIVDGPPSSFVRGREACLHQVAAHLKVGARVYLDDALRPDETRIVRNWLKSYRGLRSLGLIEIGHGIHVLEVSASLNGPRFHPLVLADNVAVRLASLRSPAGNRARAATPDR